MMPNSLPGPLAGGMAETGSAAPSTAVDARTSTPPGLGPSVYETPSHRNRTSSLSTASLSVPLGSFISQITEFGSTISNLHSTIATGRAERSRSATSALSNARLTLRVTREIQDEPLASGGGEERLVRRPDPSFNRALLRHLGSGRPSHTQGDDSSGASAADEEEGEQEGEVEEEETTAAAAERHRLSSGTPGIDLQVGAEHLTRIEDTCLRFRVYADGKPAHKCRAKCVGGILCSRPRRLMCWVLWGGGEGGVCSSAPLRQLV
jgi:hypothetical protein